MHISLSPGPHFGPPPPSLIDLRAFWTAWAMRAMLVLLTPAIVGLALAWSPPESTRRMTVSATILSRCAVGPAGADASSASPAFNLRCNTPTASRVQTGTISIPALSPDLAAGARSRVRTETIGAVDAATAPAAGAEQVILYTIEY